MYNYFKKIVTANGNITEIAKKIGIYHLRGQLTDTQAQELYDMLYQHANPESNRPEVTVTLAAINERLVACEDALSKLEAAMKKLSGAAEDDEASDNEDTVDYPDWIPWDGVSHNYRYGDIVRHNGELWISEYSAQNTWEPGVIGTERLWVKYIVTANDEGES